MNALMTPLMMIVRSGEIDLAVYRWPHSAEKPTLVLVHGYPDSASVWDGLANELGDRFNVVAYDVRGAGRSGKPKSVSAYALPRLVADLKAVIDAVSPAQPVHLVGHDWGSIQAWEAVVDDALRSRIASYTTISGPSLDHAGHWLAERLRSKEPARIKQALRQLAHSWYVGLFQLPLIAPTLWRSGLAKHWTSWLAWREGVSTTPSATQASDGAIGVKLYRANVRGRLGKARPRATDLPVQLIVPLRDAYVLPDLTEDLQRWAPRLWRREIDAGHWVQLSHPHELASWIAEFAGFVDGRQYNEYSE